MKTSRSTEVASHTTTQVTTDDLKALVYGACFLASGGGGPISMALNFLQRMKHPVALVQRDQLAHDKLAAIAADMGSPDATLHGHGYSAPVNAFKAFEALLKEKHPDEALQYLLPIEIGAVNSLIPFFISEQLGSKISVVDTDPSGRSVPQLNETLLDLSDQPIYPAMLASDTDADGKYHSNPLTESLTPTELEDKARDIVSSSDYQQVGGLCCYPMQSNWLLSAETELVKGSLTKAMELGKTLLSSTHSDDLKKALKALGVDAWLLFEGELTDIKNKTAHGFDVGKLVFTNTDKEQLWVYYKNESLIAWDPQQGKPWVLAPDCINIRLLKDHGDKLKGSPLSTADIAMHQHCEVWGTACDIKMRDSRMVSRFQQNISQIIAAYPDDGLQHHVGYQPIETLMEHKSAAEPASL